MNQYVMRYWLVSGPEIQMHSLNLLIDVVKNISAYNIDMDLFRYFNATMGDMLTIIQYLPGVKIITLNGNFRNKSLLFKINISVIDYIGSIRNIISTILYKPAEMKKILVLLMEIFVPTIYN